MSKNGQITGKTHPTMALKGKISADEAHIFVN